MVNEIRVSPSAVRINDIVPKPSDHIFGNIILSAAGEDQVYVFISICLGSADIKTRFKGIIQTPVKKFLFMADVKIKTMEVI